MNREYYKEYYNLERFHWWFRIREKIILERIEELNIKDVSILNIGAATGRSSEVLSKFGEVTSIEYDKECCEFTTKELGLSVINASATDLPFDNEKFDLVCAFDIIEHIENHSDAIKEMVRVCKPNGIVFITVPSFMIMWSEHDVVNQHYRRYRLREVLNLFNPYGGKIIRKTYFNFLLSPLILSFRVFSHLLPKNLFRKGAGSDFTLTGEKSIINKINENIFKLEIPLLKKINFPFGVSALLIWKKSPH